MKHIEMDCHFVGDAIQDGKIATSHVRAHAQLVNIFTKLVQDHRFISSFTSWEFVTFILQLEGEC